MERKLRKMLAALLCCALLLSCSGVALGDAIETETVGEANESTADEIFGDTIDELNESAADEIYGDTIDEGEAPAIDSGEDEALVLEDEVSDFVADDEVILDLEEEALIVADEPEVAADADKGEDDADGEEAETISEEVEITLAEALGMPEVAEDDSEDEQFYTENDFDSLVWAEIQGFDANGDGALTQTELDMVDSLYLDGEIFDSDESRIISLRNIGLLRNLTSLNIVSSIITDIDLSNNTKLRSIHGQWNELNSLNLSNCAALENVDMSYSSMSSLILGNHPELEYIDCQNNQLTTLDVSGCAKLRNLSCNNNQLTTLDVSGCAKLETLYCEFNKLTTLDVSTCASLTELNCFYNALTYLTLGNHYRLEELFAYGNALPSLELGEMPKLTRLYVANNQLSSLDVSGCPDLEQLYCENNQMSSLVLTGCSMLSDLDCRNNNLSSLVLDNKPSLGFLRCEGNLLTELDISMCDVLVFCYNEEYRVDPFDVDEGQDEDTVNYYRFEIDYSYLAFTYDAVVTVITSESVGKLALTASNFPDANFLKIVKSFDLDKDKYLSDGEIHLITNLYIENSKVTNLKGIEHLISLKSATLYVSPKMKRIDLSKNVQLVSLDIEAGLTSIDLSNNAKLQDLYLNRNALPYIDLSNNLELWSIGLGDNQLTVLDLSHNTELRDAYLNNNRLTELDLSNNPHLMYLRVENNALTALDLNNNPMLTDLRCSKNPLTSLDLSRLTELVHLYCSSTKLNSLNLSNNHKLTRLLAQNIGLNSLDLSNTPDLETARLTGNKFKTLDISGIENCARIENAWIESNKSGLVMYIEGRDNECELRVDHTVEITREGNPIKCMLLKKATGTKKSIFPGDRLIPSLYGAKAKSVKTSKKTVATAVKRGQGVLITAKGYGTAVITVTLTNKATRQLTVTVIDPNAPKSVSLPKTARVPLDETLTLEAVMVANRAGEEPISALKWTTSDKRIATVADGAVTPKKTGVVNITVTTVTGKKTATCKVTVEDPNKPKGIALDQTTKSCYAGELENFPLVPTITWWDGATEEAKANNASITWSSSDTKIATVKKTEGGALVTPVGYGKVTITAKTINGKSAKCTVKIAKNKLDKIHAKPTATQIKKLAKTHPRGYLKSIEIVNSKKIVLEWYLMNGKSKTLVKTPTMEMYVRYPMEEVVPNDGEGNEGEEDDAWEYIVATDYDNKTVNVPANSYKIIKTTLTPGKCYMFKTDVLLSTVKEILDWGFGWVGE